MKTTKAHMRKILRTLQKMQIADGFERDFQIKSCNSDDTIVVMVTFIYPAINPTEERKWDVYSFAFYDFYEKETNDAVLTKIQNHINEHPTTDKIYTTRSAT